MELFFIVGIIAWTISTVGTYTAGDNTLYNSSLVVLE